MSWIQWTKGLATRPEVLRMADLLKLDNRIVAVLCMTWWEWCDEQGTFVTPPSRDCHAPGVTPSHVDRHVGVRGFAAAMQSVGWMRHDQRAPNGGDLVMPRLGLHVGKSAKEREKAAERQKAHRDRVTEMSRQSSRSERDVSVTREEKRREEKREESKPREEARAAPASPAPVGWSLLMVAAWDRWEKHRTEIRKPIRPTMRLAMQGKLASWGEPRAVAAIDHTIAMGWQGLREPEPGRASPNGYTSAADLRRAKQRDQEYD
jgi:hypothetical protein